MNPVTTTLTKKTYKLDDGNLIAGVEVSLCPMVYKFISITNQKLSLIEQLRPDLYQWFVNSSEGSVLTLSEEYPVTVHSN